MKILILVVILGFISHVGYAKCDPEEQIEVLALNMYHEARGEGIDSMQMVGEVTLNRVNHHRYPNDICSVVYQPSQFSWTRVIKNHEPSEEKSWKKALEISESLLNEELELFDNGATHFLNPNKVSRMPLWTKSFEVVGKMGNHVFYEKQ